MQMAVVEVVEAGLVVDGLDFMAKRGRESRVSGDRMGRSGTRGCIALFQGGTSSDRGSAMLAKMDGVRRRRSANDVQQRYLTTLSVHDRGAVGPSASAVRSPSKVLAPATLVEGGPMLCTDYVMQHLEF